MLKLLLLALPMLPSPETTVLGLRVPVELAAPPPPPPLPTKLPPEAALMATAILSSFRLVRFLRRARRRWGAVNENMLILLRRIP